MNKPLRIFLCGHNHYSYLDFIAKGFEENNCLVDIFSHKYVHVEKMYRGNIFRRWKNGSFLKMINRKIIDRCKQIKPDLFLAINGEALFSSTLQQIKHESPAVTALWLVDSYESLRLSYETVKTFDVKFIFEPTDSAHIPNAIFLPYGCATHVYRPLASRSWCYDVGFVGAGHLNRLELLNKVAAYCDATGLRFGVWGPFGVFLKKEKKHYVHKYENLYNAIVKNGSISPEDICSIYNQVKINLNIHHPQSKDGVNVRTFEIAGSKSFQLVDNKKTINSLFGNNEIVTFDSVDELLSLIKHYVDFEYEREEIAAAAFERVVSQHTFPARCRMLLKSVGFSSE